MREFNSTQGGAHHRDYADWSKLPKPALPPSVEICPECGGRLMLVKVQIGIRDMVTRIRATHQVEELRCRHCSRQYWIDADVQDGSEPYVIGESL